jgi:hypothetical protein
LLDAIFLRTNKFRIEKYNFYHCFFISILQKYK